ncbi:N-methyl-L-tryptophan oxidase-like [Glandiceps talaboti]
MADTSHYDICIVGAGMIGSAAARHATITAPSLKVCLIGPKEPNKHECKHEIFGAHYDEGRMIRSLDAGPMWAELGRRSIARFRDLEHRTGVEFYREVGHMTWSRKGDPYLEKVKDNATLMKVKLQELDTTKMEAKFPFLSMKSYDEVILQTEDAGYVSPRAQVKAQQTAAHLHGCDIINDVVDQVTETNQSDGSKCMKVTTAKGQVIHARRVLLTTGAFTGFRDLLPHGKELDVQLSGATLLFAELSDKDAVRLKDMPCLIYKENDSQDKYDCYVLPPIKYPDGRCYLKIGHRTLYKKELYTAAEVDEWFRSKGDESALRPLAQKLLELIKGVKPVSFHGESCVLTYTPTLLPYCDTLTPTLGVAIGGNGVGAKVADEIGRMAARMVIAGCWDHDLPRDNFRVRFIVNQKMTAKL